MAGTPAVLAARSAPILTDNLNSSGGDEAEEKKK
jgi:hypothetical protein